MKESLCQSILGYSVMIAVAPGGRHVARIRVVIL